MLLSIRHFFTSFRKNSRRSIWLRRLVYSGVVLRNGTGPVGLQQKQQVIHSGLVFPALVSIRYPQPHRQLFKDHAVAGDIVVVVNGVVLAGERLVGNHPVMPGVVDQGVAGDAGGGLVGFTETAVDDQQLAAALDGAFALADLHGNMAVDDVAVLPFQAEFLQQHIAYSRILIIGVIGVLGFCPGAFVLNEPALQGGHPVTAEDRAVAARPQPPEEVQTELALRCAALVVVGLSCGFLRVIQKCLAGTHLAADGEFHEAAVLGHGDAAVEQQVAVDHLIKTAPGEEEAHMLLQLFTVAEGFGEL